MLLYEIPSCLYNIKKIPVFLHKFHKYPQVLLIFVNFFNTRKIKIDFPWRDKIRNVLSHENIIILFEWYHDKDKVEKSLG